jgi:hypothetical protein
MLDASRQTFFIFSGRKNHDEIGAEETATVGWCSKK